MKLGVDLAEARHWWALVAEAEDFLREHAQCRLGELLEASFNTPDDSGEAVKWYTKAAESGDVTAQLNLARLHALGLCGLGQNQRETMRWYVLAAQQGNKVAQYSIGRMYHNGDGVLQDFNKAEKWYKMAAECEVPSFQFALGRLYEEKGDYVSAHAWYNLAASSEEFEVDFRLNSRQFTEPAVAAVRAEYVDARNSVARKLQPTQVTDAQKLATEIKANNLGFFG